jgi:hypothetical protein
MVGLNFQKQLVNFKLKMKTLVLFLLCTIALLSASPINCNSGNGHMGGASAPKENYCQVCDGDDTHGGIVQLGGFSGSDYIKTLVCGGRNPNEGGNSLTAGSVSQFCPCTVLLFFFLFFYFFRNALTDSAQKTLLQNAMNTFTCQTQSSGNSGNSGRNPRSSSRGKFPNFCKGPFCKSKATTVEEAEDDELEFEYE